MKKIAKHILSVLCISLYVIIFGSVMHVVHADVVSVTNTISVSAETGGNSTSGSSSGTVVQGQSKASASVTTIVNGEVVTDVYEEKVGTAGEPVSIIKKIQTQKVSAEIATSVATTPPEVLNSPNIRTHVFKRFFKYVLQFFTF